ncbi:MAG: glycoside hydrolase family 3 C-terminal domain-containing protein [Chloroflexi bacterium]|nr:glycoside hydrolase family 3 C-terminal domain-containing protein [Chloroflexota bacterium]
MTEQPAYNNTALSFEERVDDLVARMTLEEKVSQTVHDAPAIERLDIPAYNWWNECLHGVGRAGIATVFPQAIGMAATWNAELLFEVASATADEGRAKHHQALREGNHGQYYGLTFWTPNINIFRDPRWGRGQETYGECPYLTSRLGVAFVKGLQGDDPKYLKTVATAKHYAVHSGPEHDRHHFDINVSKRDLRETYLPAFKATVQEGRAYSVMSAYQRFRGEPCSSSTLLLQDILRDEWGFEGFVVSDCGAIYDIFAHHKVVKTGEEAAARALKAGCELNCGQVYGMLIGAVEQGLIDEATIDKAVKRLFLARFKLGMFDPPEMVPYAQIPYEVNACTEHSQLALQTAHQSMVLLKNDGLLPLDKSRLNTIAVIGPNADSVEVLLGNYNGIPAQPVTPLTGIRQKVGDDVDVLYVRGCNLLSKIKDTGRTYNEQFAAAVDIARRADVVIMVLGLSQVIEGEEGQQDGLLNGTSQGDRQGLGLPDVQQELLQTVYEVGKPVVMVLLNGSPVSVTWANEHIPAIVEAWYPGQAGGTALADVLFGDYNPAGRLPVTIYKSLDQLPLFTDYDIVGRRTYRYFEGEPLYPFGYGLSYTRFTYSDLQITPEQTQADGDAIDVSVAVTNSGQRAGDEVVQLYLRDVEGAVHLPKHQLAGFKRIHLQPGEQKIVYLTLQPEQFSLVLESGKRVIEPGQFEVFVGSGQPGFTDGVLTGQIELIGEKVWLEA